MGQYYYVTNLDKKEYLHPHKFDDGLKLMEFSRSACGTMTGLAILLAVGNGRGGGDLRSNNRIIGSWAGDRIAIVGDYADKETVGVDWEDLADWEDISEKVLVAMRDDEYIAQTIDEQEQAKSDLLMSTLAQPGAFDAVLGGQ